VDVDEVRPDVASLTRGALDWLPAMARDTGAGLAWTGRPDDDELNPTLYGGSAGIVLAFLDGYRHFGEDEYADAAVRGARAIAAAVDDDWTLSSLHFGVTGMAFALRAVHDVLGDRYADDAATRALGKVHERFDGQRWGDHDVTTRKCLRHCRRSGKCRSVSVAVRSNWPPILGVTGWSPPNRLGVGALFAGQSDRSR